MILSSPRNLSVFLRKCDNEVSLYCLKYQISQ